MAGFEEHWSGLDRDAILRLLDEGEQGKARALVASVLVDIKSPRDRYRLVIELASTDAFHRHKDFLRRLVREGPEFRIRGRSDETSRDLHFLRGFLFEHALGDWEEAAASYESALSDVARERLAAPQTALPSEVESLEPSDRQAALRLAELRRNAETRRARGQEGGRR